jgi:hypothetical protein
LFACKKCYRLAGRDLFGWTGSFLGRRCSRSICFFFSTKRLNLHVLSRGRDIYSFAGQSFTLLHFNLWFRSIAQLHRAKYLLLSQSYYNYLSFLCLFSLAFLGRRIRSYLLITNCWFFQNFRRGLLFDFPRWHLLLV